MNSILLRPNPVKSPAATGRILAIEPDAGRAAVLRQVLREHARVDLEIVTRVEEALRSISDRVPDLVLTSAFLQPADEAALSAHVSQVPEASHVQIISAPYFIDADEVSPPKSPHPIALGFLRRRPASIRPRCSAATFRRQIEDYLEQAAVSRLERIEQARYAALTPAEGISSRGLSQSPDRTTAGAMIASGSGRQADHPSDRRRARRRRAGEFPSLWSIRLPWGSEVKVVDISRRGVLIESPSKIAAGSIVDLQLVGEDTNLLVPARTLRTDVAAVDSFGVRYRIAAAFSRELDLAGLEPGDAPALSPRTLVDLLTRIMGEADSHVGSAALRARFETELRQLLRLRDIQIRTKPMIAEQGAESIYFTLPGGSRSPGILQAVYEPGYVPSTMEFRLLKSASSLAAVVLGFDAPSGEAPAPARRIGF